MYRSLLVPLDGSGLAEHALPLALSIARRTGATLHLVRVHTPVPAGVEAIDSTMDDSAREEESIYLNAMTTRLTAAAAVPVSSRLLDGPIAAVLDEHALAMGSDLIVMTTHGRGLFARFWLGSVADELARRVSIPVLMVRPQPGPPELRADKVLQHVLIPLDGSTLAEQMIEPAVDLAYSMQAACTLLQVIPPLGRHSIILHGQHRRHAEAYLEAILARLPAQTMHVRARVVSSEQPAVAILAEARAHNIDLIALATHGRGGFKRLLLGSVADKVLRGASASVLVYHPSGK
jgi:nucleotide-binding universal stress UspA family protein